MADERRRPTPRQAMVLRKEWLTLSMVRLVVGGPGLDDFGPPVHADSYVKVHFPEHQAMRSYTVRAWDSVRRELTLDFVMHGAEGIAGPWAVAVQPGDPIHLLGPGGGYSPDPDAGWHLLAGDTSALPAIAVALEELKATCPDARGHAVIEVHGSQDVVDLAAPSGVFVRWVHTGRHGRPGDALVEAVRALPWRPDPQAFVHGEAGAVRDLRRYLRGERGVGMDRLSISGYWRLGDSDEAWRAAKRFWLAEIEDAEAKLIA